MHVYLSNLIIAATFLKQTYKFTICICGAYILIDA
jgi:hypothetical protein